MLVIDRLDKPHLAVEWMASSGSAAIQNTNILFALLFIQFTNKWS